MRIGIVPGLNFSDGGIYQYSLTMLEALDRYRTPACADEYLVFATDLRDPHLQNLNRKDWVLKPLLPPTLRRQSIKLLEKAIGRRPRETALKLRSRLRTQRTGAGQYTDTIQLNHEMNRWFRANEIELMLYPVSTSLSFEAGIPYVMTVHDLQHRLQPEFPEVSANGEWESREYIFNNGIRKAIFVLAESETGKEDILNFYGEYGVTADRIKVLPLLASPMLPLDVSENDRRTIRAKYNLPERFLFYPAQFWPHKNHVRIIEALGLLKERHGLEIPIVLCGSRTGDLRQQTFHEVLSTAARLQIERQLHVLGYVSDQEIACLYKTARALVMPTFFGATNIPPLEAWALGCPVLTSDIRGIREQAGSAAVLADPKSVESIADGIYDLWTDDALCHELVKRGLARTKEFTLTDFASRLLTVIRKAKSRIRAASTAALKSQ